MEHNAEREFIVSPTGETVESTPSQPPVTGEPIVQDDSGPLAQVREGMRVVDAAGEEIGKVDGVKMGDPESPSLEGQVAEDSIGLLGNIKEAFGFGGEPNLPPTLAARLLRTGFIHVDGKGWIDTDRYVSAESVGSVEGETVRLTVTKDQLAEES
jgi:hypothetical protein